VPARKRSFRFDVLAGQLGLPTLAVAIIRDGNVTVTGHQFQRSATYQAGSLTKLVVAIAILQLEAKGRLSLSDPVALHLPWFSNANTTILDLLRHTSGLPRGRLYFSDPSTSELQATLAASGTSGPTAYAHYSNLGYLALGLVIQAVTRQPFEKVLRETVLDPFGMKGSGFGSPPASLSAPHALRAFREDCESPLDYAPATVRLGPQAAMGLWSTLEDIALLAMWLMDEGRSLLPLCVPETDRQQIGPGFRVQRAWGQEALFEYAEHFGHCASVMVLPESRFGVVALTNRGSAALDLARVVENVISEWVPNASPRAPVDARGKYLAADGIQLSVGGHPGNWSAAIDGEEARPFVYRGQRWFIKQGGEMSCLPFRAVEGQIHVGCRIFRSVELPEIDLEIAPAYNDLVGIYWNAAVGRVAVVERSGTFILAYSPFNEVRLKSTSDEVFIQQDGPFATELVEFRRSARELHLGGFTYSHTGIRQ
jgi:CubicO group peptidase (beta-lactamase class C family)